LGQHNPFLNYHDSLVATADFLGRRLESTDMQLELKKAGVTEEYEVTMAENAQGPFLTLTLEGDDKAHLITSASTLARFADTTLVRIQEQNGVSVKDQIRLTQVIPPQKPEAEMKTKLELVIVAVGGTMALAFVLTFIVESVSRRRQIKANGELQEADGGVLSGSAPLPRVALGGVNSPGFNKRADVGEETRVLRSTPTAIPKLPEKPAPVTGPSPDNTAIITTATPLRSDRVRQHADPPVHLPRQPAASGGGENPSRGKAGPPAGGKAGAPVSPAAGTPRVGSPTTYQSKSADRRGQDANRVNGS
jgi:hypothetical protein